MCIFQRILMDAFFITILTWCAYTDIQKRTVSNASIILILCLGIAHTILMALAGHTWWQYPAGIVLPVPFYVAWLRGQMGAGDVKLIIGISLYLGVLNTLIAFALIMLTLIVLMVRSWIKTKTLKSVIPFAPILAFGAIGTVVLGYLYTFLQI